MTIPGPPVGRPPSFANSPSFVRRYKTVPPVSAVGGAFTEEALRMQQLGVWRAGEKTLRERQASSDRDMVEAARAHEAAIASLHRHFEAEAGAMYKRVRSAKQRQAAVAKEAEALRSRRAKLAHELRTLEARCDEKLAEAQQESERVAVRLQEEDEKATQLEATGRRRAPRAAVVADEHTMPDRDRMQVLDEQRQSLRATVQIGREYVAWLEAQLAACAACAAEAGAAQGAPTTPQRGEQSKSRRGPPRVPSPKPLPAAKPPPPPAHAPAPAPAQGQVQAGAQSRAAAAEVHGAALDDRIPRSNAPASQGGQQAQGQQQQAQGQQQQSQHAKEHAKGEAGQHAAAGQHSAAAGPHSAAAGQHAAADPSKKKAPALPDLLGGSGGAAASDAQFDAFGAELEVLKAVAREMSGNPNPNPNPNPNLNQVLKAVAREMSGNIVQVVN